MVSVAVFMKQYSWQKFILARLWKIQGKQINIRHWLIAKRYLAKEDLFNTSWYVYRYVH